MDYTVVIRTLGKAGEKYQQLLNSINCQTISPSAIIVYIAEGYELPRETIGIEQYVNVKKGMVAQRALLYDEVKTPYVLFVDDDVFLPQNAVEKLYEELVANQANVISPCVFYNHQVGIKDKIRMTLLGREVCRVFGSRWAYKVLRTGGFSYCNHPTKSVYESQSNAGPCFFCSKADFLSIHYDEELWLDETYYALPDDQIMFYKMYCNGLKILTTFDTGIEHLDAGSTQSQCNDKLQKLIYSEYRNKLIFWHRFIFLPERNLLLKLWAVVALGYAYGIQGLKYLMLYLMGKKEMPLAFKHGILDGLSFIRSSSYKVLPKIIKKR